MGGQSNEEGQLQEKFLLLSIITGRRRGKKGDLVKGKGNVRNDSCRARATRERARRKQGKGRETNKKRGHSQDTGGVHDVGEVPKRGPIVEKGNTERR